MGDYQWEYATKPAQKRFEDFEPGFGPVVLTRDAKGTPVKTRMKVLVDDPHTVVFLVGPFNDWGKRLRREDRFEADEHGVYAVLETSDLSHGTPYRLRVADKLFPDPAGTFFDSDGNSVFIDFARPEYALAHPRPDTFNRATKVLQTDLPGLVVHWANAKGVLGRDTPTDAMYRFIAESGVIDEVVRLGFNTVQFLPFAQSIDGDNWKFRYLVPFPFAVNNRWGSVEDFVAMVDAFHEKGVAVLMDIVVGHMPHKDFRIFGKDSSGNGIHEWIAKTGQRVYMKEYTEWGTMRPDYENAHVRRFLIDSAIHFMARLGIDGFRVDNVDGILRYGANGEGADRASGRLFLQEFNREVYAYDPKALVHFEAHYFKDDNAKMLTAPLNSEPRALGATAYTSSRLTYYFHTDFMLKEGRSVSAWRFKHIAEEKEWGKSNSTIADFHNHDAAAGLMPMRATGSYAYDAMTQNPYNHIHAVGKIKVMEAIISFGCEGRTLDLLQSFLLQSGTFEHDSSIQWYLTFNEANRGMVAYKQRVNELLDDPAFWPQNVTRRAFLNVDDENKILVIERSAPEEDRYVIVINLTAAKHYEYRVGVRTKRPYKVVFNSDSFRYSGFGVVSYPDALENTPSTSFEVLDREVVLDVVAPYGIVVLRECE
ncbi:MAG: alpha-amylase family glycosyl hydrolase [Candidatus Woesearchaeota archaeon]